MGSKIPTVNIGLYDPFNALQTLQPILDAKVHLTNIHWRKSSVEPLRSIAKLPITFFEETPKNFDQNELGPIPKLDQVPVEKRKDAVLKMLSVPYIRCMLIQCNDVEAYRATARPLIREWYKSNITSSNSPVHAYLILYGDDSKAQHRLFEKLKVDFESEFTSDKCIFIKSNFEDPAHEHELWGTVNLAFKQSVLASFAARLDILRSFQTKLSSIDEIKENTTLFLAVQDGIASQFLTMHLFEEAKTEYETLRGMITLHQDNPDLFPEQSWSDQDPHAMEKFMTQLYLFPSSTTKVSLYDAKSFIFAKIFVIFEALADSASSLSLSSIRVAACLQELQNYIHEILRDFNTHPEDHFKLHEWAYMMVNDVLSLDICLKVATLEPDEAGESNQVSERFGELLLLQRSSLLDLGQSYDYFISGVLTDIRMSSVSERKEIDYEPLKKVMESEKSFQDHFILLTETALNHFSVSNRPRTVDALSIDIALLDYENKQYEKAAIVLSTCPEFYSSQGWDVIGYSLLEAYIDCLENMDEKCDFFTAGDEAIVKSELLSQCYIDVLSSLKMHENSLPPTLIKKAVDHLSTTTAGPGKEQVSDVEDFFAVSPDVYVTCTGDDIYQVNINLTSKIPHQISLKDVKLILENARGETLEFEGSSLDVCSGSCTVPLSTTAIQFGSFALATFTAKFGPISMVHIFDGESKKHVEVLPVSKCLKMNIGTSTEIDLNVKPVSVFIDTDRAITDLVLKVWRQSHTFSIQEGVILKSDNGHETPSDFSEDTISFDALEQNKSYEVIIPFITPENPKIKTLDLCASLAYKIDGSPRLQTVTKSIDPALSIAVSVQDIFKSDGLYSRFTIGVADTDLPVRIITVDLDESDGFAVCSPLKPGPLVAFAEQPGNFFFKIIEKADGHPSSEEFLDLNIRYREISEEMSEIWKSQLTNDLAAKGLENYIDILCHSSSTLKFDCNEYVLNQKLKVLNVDMFLKSSFRAIPDQDRSLVYSIFDERIQNGVQLSYEDLVWKDKLLKIKVLIPCVEVIHTVELKTDSNQNHMALGDEITATLDITSLVSSRVEARSEKPDGKKLVLFQDEQSPLNRYSVEVLPNQDTWLINGKTRFVIDIDKSDKKQHIYPSVKLSLIPLRVGKLALPKIKITNMNMNSKNEYLMEVDYKNESETINVISGSI
ncbi:CYFA0S12e01728g1_1 [Cyberlindnera fabianii]|uniref:CYFA0S12e01728g1_1 n=1 Tax=Cyberlindnera fabianii TaxID=36022 RepID=A0A061B0Z5_CYBFA|nr:Trafficking protein particle complex subunit 10 [Cyberlindnera fabianii]CDR43546.1 CYFA0S12e01728g1_1 [Cyberlindnera fabianii]